MGRIPTGCGFLHPLHISSSARGHASKLQSTHKQCAIVRCSDDVDWKTNQPPRLSRQETEHLPLVVNDEKLVALDVAFAHDECGVRIWGREQSISLDQAVYVVHLENFFWGGAPMAEVCGSCFV